jgi:hypothetical protein
MVNYGLDTGQSRILQAMCYNSSTAMCTDGLEQDGVVQVIVQDIHSNV